MSRQFPNFKQFLDERVGDDYLYHNTDTEGAVAVVNSGILGKRNRVSFTRDRNYNWAPGTRNKPEVRFVFNRTKLKQNTKLIPYADRTVTSRKDNRRNVQGAEARWESEEVATKPVKIKNSLIRIEILKPALDRIKANIKNFQGYIEKNSEAIEMAKKGYFWHGLSQEYRKIENSRQQDVADRAGINQKTYQGYIDEYEKFISDPRLKIVNNFK